MKYFICTIFLCSLLVGCQQLMDTQPAAIEFVEFPIHHPNILDDEDWLFEPISDSSGWNSPSGVGDTLSQFNNCIEIITVDFEPAPFGDFVQTIPYHPQKETIHDAFVSVKMQTQQIPWVIYFYSSEVSFAPQAFIAFDDYGGDLDRYISGDQSICEVHLWDTIQAHNYLYTFEQLIMEVEIECYNL